MSMNYQPPKDALRAKTATPQKAEVSPASLESWRELLGGLMIKPITRVALRKRSDQIFDDQDPDNPNQDTELANTLLAYYRAAFGINLLTEQNNTLLRKSFNRMRTFIVMKVPTDAVSPLKIDIIDCGEKILEQAEQLLKICDQVENG